MRIQLIRPDLVHSSHSLYRQGLRHSPLGLLYLGTALRRAGHEVFLTDEIAGDEAVGDMARHRPDMVGISVASPLTVRAAEISRKAQEFGAKVVIGGPHPSALPQQSLEETGAHVAVLREGEETLVELASGEPLADVKGIVYREDDDIVHTGHRPLNMDLDSIPIPDLSLLDWSKYRNDREFGFPGKGVIRVISSRGCNSSCTFCSRHTVFTRNTRFRSPENLRQELLAQIAVRRTKKLVFMDDTFTENLEHAEAITRMLLESGLDLTWVVITKVGIPRDLLALMYRAGCRMVEMGIESGSQRVLDRIKKNISVEAVEETFRLAREVGMKTKAFFMVGLPGEEREDFEQSMDLAKRINPDYLWLSIFIPLPGAEAFTDQHRAKADYLDRTFVSSHDPETNRRFREFLRRFYLRPGYLPVMLRNYRGYLDLMAKVGALSHMGHSSPRSGRTFPFALP